MHYPNRSHYDNDFAAESVIKETQFAGPTCFQRGDNNYYTDKGDKVATQRSTAIRYHSNLARDMNSLAASDDPACTDDELAELENKKFEWIKMLHELGLDKRYWNDVQIGDKLPPRVFGPHNVVRFATEWRAYLFTLWCGVHRRTDLDMEAPGFTGPFARPSVPALGSLHRHAAGLWLRRVDFKMTNQLGTTMSTAKAEIQLPTKSA